MTNSLSYTVLQLAPDPIRDERSNVGVLVFDFEKGSFAARVLDESNGLKKKVGQVPVRFAGLAVSEMQNRIRSEMSHGAKEARISALIASRANTIRMLPLRPTFGSDAEREADRLFEIMVALDAPKGRKTRVGTALKNGLRHLNALERFDINPERVTLPRYRTDIQADLGARREHYHLIQAVRFDEPDSGLSFIGRNAMIARALAERHSMKLVVVGDFGNQPSGYYQSVKEDLEREKAAVYRLDQLEAFASDYVTLH